MCLAHGLDGGARSDHNHIRQCRSLSLPQVRLAKTGAGKSGGYRVMTFFARRAMPVYVFAVLAKGSRANFDPDEINAMSVMAQRILQGLRPKAVG